MKGRIEMDEIGRRIATLAGCVGAGALLCIGTWFGGAAAGGSPYTPPEQPRSTANTSTASTAPSTLATSIAIPTKTATPYGGTGH